jgi:hypothetical protein
MYEKFYRLNHIGVAVAVDGRYLDCRSGWVDGLALKYIYDRRQDSSMPLSCEQGAGE